MHKCVTCPSKRWAHTRGYWSETNEGAGGPVSEHSEASRGTGAHCPQACSGQVRLRFPYLPRKRGHLASSNWLGPGHISKRPARKIFFLSASKSL